MSLVSFPDLLNLLTLCELISQALNLYLKITESYLYLKMPISCYQHNYSRTASVQGWKNKSLNIWNGTNQMTLLHPTFRKNTNHTKKKLLLEILIFPASYGFMLSSPSFVLAGTASGLSPCPPDQGLVHSRYTRNIC